MQRWKKLRLRISHFYFLRNHKKLSFNIPKSTLINFCLNIFFAYIVSLNLPGISFDNYFIKIGTACLSFVMYILFLEDDLLL